MLEVRGGTRRETLERLFYDKNIVVEWRYNGVADEIINGRYVGTIQKVALMLLEGTNYLMVYQPPTTTGSAAHLAHLIVYGRASSGTATLSPPMESSNLTPTVRSQDPASLQGLTRIRATEAAVSKKAAQLGNADD